MESKRSYELKRQLSSGQDGVAYLAYCANSGESVIHCRINQKSTELASVQKRVEQIRRITSKGLLAIDDCEFRDGSAYVVYLSWPELTLDQYLDSIEHLSERAFRNHCQTLVELIAEAQRCGLSHGSVTSTTVMVDAEGELKLDLLNLDFGLKPSTASHRIDDLRGLGQVIERLLSRTQFHDDLMGLSKLLKLKWSKLISRSQSQELREQPIIEDFKDVVRETRINHPTSSGLTSEVNHAGEFQSSDSFTLVTPLPLASSGTFDGATIDGSSPAQQSQSGDVVGAGTRLGNYEVIRKLGEGGMGAVFKAKNCDSGKLVAIKVLSQRSMNNTQSIRRFQKEARLLSSIKNPHITNLIDVGLHNNSHYLVLEFVSGIDLKKVLNQTISLDERQALGIIADVCRALRDAHEMGMVHRDIKPENILIEIEGDPTSWRGSQIEGDYRVKLSDFGIARFIDQSESMAMTQAYSLVGTPLYMSPEQFKGQGDITSQSDVYALGATLFELLTGKVPYFAPDAMRLASMHCFDAIPLPSKLNPKVTTAVDEIITKALAKKPEDRYADAAHLLKDIERLLTGGVSDIELHPILPTYDPAKLFRCDFVWELDSTPEELWPFVSNTERFNRAVGIPAVNFKTTYDDVNGTRRFGSFKMGGVSISWEEHPFEWVEGKRMSVLRTFEKGPFKWFTSIVELERREDGGTRLHHKVRIDPANTFGKWLARFEVKIKSARIIERVYRRIDQSIRQQKQNVTGCDPFEDGGKLQSMQQKRVVQRLEKLRLQPVSSRLIDAFGEWLQKSPIQELQKIRPVPLASKLHASEEETLDLCLYAAEAGLLTLQWDILCPTCRVAADTRQSLKELESHTHCEACHLDFKSDLANSIEMIFQIHPELREATPGKYCIGGPWHAPHVVSQMKVRSGECVELELQLGPGEYLVRGQHLPYSISLHVNNGVAPSHAELEFAAKIDPRHTPVLRAGKQVLQIRNSMEHDRIIRVERTIPRHDVITAARATAYDSFRRLFPDEVLRPEQLVSTEQVTLLMAVIADSESLYERLGDTVACRQIQYALRAMEDEIRTHGGCVIKSVGEGLLAAFQESGHAVRTSFKLPQRLRDDDSTAHLSLRIGVHSGPAVVTTVNGRLDYFGGAARLVTRLPDQARGIVLTEAVYRDPLVSSWLAQQNIKGELASMKVGDQKTELIQHFIIEKTSP